MSKPLNPIHLVVFDLGKVLLDFDYGIAARRLSRDSSLTPEQILDLLLRTPLLHRYELGELTSVEFHQALVRDAGLRSSLEDFAIYFGDIFSPIQPMLDLLHRFQKSRLRTAVLSNTNELAIQFIRPRYPFFNQFNHHVFSFEHGAMKPDPALYRVIERLSAVPPAQIVFLDDRPENVEAALQLGWHAFVHQDPDSTHQAFTRFGLT